MRRLIQLAATATVVSLIAGWPANAGGPTVRAVNFDFKPKRVSVNPGERVIWKNVEGRHTVTAKKGNFDKVISGDERVSRTFRSRERGATSAGSTSTWE